MFNFRAPVDVVTVIDRSGSMSDQKKMVLVKETLGFVIKQLKAADRLGSQSLEFYGRLDVSDIIFTGIVIYDEHIETVLPLTGMNAEGKVLILLSTFLATPTHAVLCRLMLIVLYLRFSLAAPPIYAQVSSVDLMSTESAREMFDSGPFFLSEVSYIHHYRRTWLPRRFCSPTDSPTTA